MAIRVGLFGAGWAARTVHGPSLVSYKRRRRGIVLAGVCDTDPDRAKEACSVFGFERAYGDARKMLRAADLDAAIVAVSVAHNADVARQCIRRGLPILLEKPPALTRRRVAALAQQAERRGGQVLVAFNRRWAPALARMRDRVRRAGPVRSVACEMRRIARADPDFTVTAIHGIDTLRYLAGSDYDRVDFLYGRCGPSGRAVAYAGQGSMTSGATVRFETVPMAGMFLERYTVVAGSKTLVAELGQGKGRNVFIEWSGGKRRELRVRVPSRRREDVGGFYQEVAALLDGVRRGRRLPGPDVRESVQSVAVMESLARRRPRFRAR